jgi:hypothetical protein
VCSPRQIEAEYAAASEHHQQLIWHNKAERLCGLEIADRAQPLIGK